MRQPIDDVARIVIDFCCPIDGESLRGKHVDGVCGRCGGTVARPLAQALGRCDDDGRLTVDAPCARCGYNLRSQSVDACCTECGTPVSRSAFKVHLSDAPVAWLRLVRLGLDLVLLAIIAAAIVPLLFMLVWSLQAYGGAAQWSPNPSETLVRSYYASVISVVAIGALLITLRDPTLVDSCQRRSRWLARVAIGTLYLTMFSLIALHGELDESILRAILIVGSIAVVTVIWRAAYRSLPFRWLALLLLVLGGFAIVLCVVWYAWVFPAYMDYFQLPQGYLLDEDWCIFWLAFLGACSSYFGARYLAHLVRRAERARLASALLWLGASAGALLLATFILQLVYSRYMQQVFAAMATSTTASAPVFTPPKWMAFLSLVMGFLQWIAVGLILGAVALLPRARMAIGAALRTARERAKTPEPADKAAAGR